MKIKTVGQILADHDERNIDVEGELRDYSRELMKDQFEEVNQMAYAGSKLPRYENKDFYITLHPVLDRLLGKTVYKKIARLSCPTPIYRHIVFKYHHLSHALEYLWTIPSQKSYRYLWANRTRCLHSESPEIKRLTQFVVLMESGDLEKWVIKENGAKPDALIVIN